MAELHEICSTHEHCCVLDAVPWRALTSQGAASSDSACLPEFCWKWHSLMHICQWTFLQSWLVTAAMLYIHRGCWCG